MHNIESEAFENKKMSLVMNVPTLNVVEVRVNTTEYWESISEFVPQAGMIIIYTDYSTNDWGINVPGMKVGDGVTPISALPFLMDIPISYTEILDRPSINDIELVGNKTMTELLAGGLIIDGGDSSSIE